MKPKYRLPQRVTIGNFAEPAQLLKHLAEKRCAVSVEAQTLILDKDFRFKRSPAEAKPKLVTNRQLGFKKPVMPLETLKAIAAHDYLLCPKEMGPQLRGQYRPKKRGVLHIASEPINSTTLGPSYFRVERGDRGLPWLYASSLHLLTHPDDIWVCVERTTERDELPWI